MTAGCPRCARIEAAAKLTLRRQVLEDLDLEAEMAIGGGESAGLAMLLQFYRNVKAALANGVRGADHHGGGHGQ